MKTAIITAAALFAAVSTASADVQLTMQNGRVSLTAKDATVRHILAEWARVGNTRIVNMERVPGGPVTLELTNVPEAQALEIVLRPLSGYITAPRPVEASNLSRFDRIILMPTLASARPLTAPPPPPVVPQTPQSPPPQAADDDNDDPRPAPNVQVPPPGQRGPVFNTFPQPQVGNPAMNPQGATPQQVPSPNAPTSPSPAAPSGGFAAPGMVAPPPPTPGQVPGAPPVRRPGGP